VYPGWYGRHGGCTPVGMGGRRRIYRVTLRERDHEAHIQGLTLGRGNMRRIIPGFTLGREGS